MERLVFEKAGNETSKFIALILRHKPEEIGISLDEHGWANVDELIAGIAKTQLFTMEMLEEIVASDEKQRYSFNEDDILFRKMAEDVSFCEEVISTIMEQKITILEVTDQKDITNLQGRSVILDALCMDENGKCYNIEVQKPDIDDHQRRVRYNASCITCNYSKKGIHFEEIPDVVILFISKSDIFKSGKTTYHIDRVIRETGAVVENGLTEIYVNAAVDDGSDISKLMEIFTDSSKYDFEKFPKVSGRKQQFKVDEGGDAEMCELVEEYAKEYAEEYAKEAVAETATAAVDRMIAELNMDLPEACRILGITVEKYQEYKMKNN